VDIARAATAALAAARRTGADRIATYCGGCLLVLSMAARALPFGPRPVHVLELAAEAWGSPPSDITKCSATTTAVGVARHALPSLLSGRRFRLGGGN
jgi:hypothetical protein